MGYVLAKELSKKWNLSIRSIQQYCADGRIAGAKKMGNTWMIPSEAPKPSDNQKPTELYLSCLDALEFRKDDTMLKLPIDHKDHKALILHYEIAFLRGEIGLASKLLKDFDFVGTLNIPAMNIVAADALATGNIALFDQMMGLFSSIKETYAGEMVADLAALSEYSYHAAMHVASQEIDVFSFIEFPITTYKAALLYDSYYFYCHQNYERVAGILESILGNPYKDKFSVIDIYIHLLCGLAFKALRLEQRSDYHLERALDLALPYGFIMPFADFMFDYGFQLENAMRKRSPEFHHRVIQTCDKIWRNWVVLHNKYKEVDVPVCLSRKEMQVAFYMVQGFTNQKIAKYMGCSLSYVKKINISIFTKLMIDKRSELKKYIR